MTNILLICSAGMSTSLLVKKMEDNAKERGIEAKIWAVGQSQTVEESKKADVILLGPQVKYLLKKTKKIVGDIPLEVIPMKDYGMINGKGVLDLALELAVK